MREKAVTNLELLKEEEKKRRLGLQTREKVRIRQRAGRMRGRAQLTEARRASSRA